MGKALNRADIVGKRIGAVLLGRIDSDPDGFSACESFVRLEDGTTFEMIWPEDQILSVGDSKIATALPFQVLGDDDPWIGDEVVEVCRTERWPSIALILSSDRLLVHTDVCSPRHVRPCLLRLDEIVSRDELKPYW